MDYKTSQCSENEGKLTTEKPIPLILKLKFVIKRLHQVNSKIIKTGRTSLPYRALQYGVTNPNPV